MNPILQKEPSGWVMHTLAGMSLEEKVGQLMVSREGMRNIEETIASGRVGGFYAGNHVTAERIAKLKSLSRLPLFVAQDLEVGHCSGLLKWPSAMALGAINNHFHTSRFTSSPMQ